MVVLREHYTLLVRKQLFRKCKLWTFYYRVFYCCGAKTFERPSLPSSFPFPFLLCATCTFLSSKSLQPGFPREEEGAREQERRREQLERERRRELERAREEQEQARCEPASSQRTSHQHAQPPRCGRHIPRARGTPGTSRTRTQLEKSGPFFG